MESDVAIKVEGLGKRYRIGELHRERYLTLRDALMGAAKAPFRLVRGEDMKEAIWALKDVSFEIKRSEAVGVIGRNGAGKTTLLKLLSRITKPTEGLAEIHGRVVSLLEVGTGFHPELTGRENIFLNGAILGMKRKEIQAKFDEIVAFAEVEKFIDTPVKRYSSGMSVRLAFAVAAHLEPEILLVDEVLAVGDAAFQKKCLGKMGDVTKGGRTVLFVSHNMAAVQGLCSHGILLESGRISQIGGIEEVVEGYMRKNFEKEERTSDVFPVFNNSYGIGITDCVVKLDPDSSCKLELKVELKIESSRHLRNIGVGLSLTSINGVRVSLLAPSVTNYVIEEINGNCQCVFYCKEIDRYLSSGDYVLGVWLSKPRTEYLVKIEQATLISIPPKDMFSSGVYFEEKYHGIVPLPMKFVIQKNCLAS